MATLDPKIPGRKLAGLAAIVSLPFAYVTQALFMTASGGDVTIFDSGNHMMALTADNAGYFYAAMWTDVLGYYLIFIPVIVYAWKALRHIDENLTGIAFLCGLIYCLLGSFGAVQMAGAFGALHGSQAAGSAAAWEASIGGNWHGYWLLEAILAAIWLGGLAKLLPAAGFKGLGVGAAVLSAIWIVQFITSHAGMAEISDAALALVVILSPLWSVWLGVALLRNPEKEKN